MIHVKNAIDDIARQEDFTLSLRKVTDGICPKKLHGTTRSHVVVVVNEVQEGLRHHVEDEMKR
jgi:hypothetical protein